MKAYFSTKGQTLKNLKIKTAVIPKIFLFKVSEYKKNKGKIINKIQKKFNMKSLSTILDSLTYFYIKHLLIKQNKKNHQHY